MMLALVKSGLRNSWILTAGNLGTSCFTRHFFSENYKKLLRMTEISKKITEKGQNITENDLNFCENDVKFRKTDISF